MAGEWMKSTQQLAKLATESDHLEKEKHAVDHEVFEAQRKVDELALKGQEMSERLAQLQAEQKALMARMGFPPTPSPATAPTPRVTHSWPQATAARLPSLSLPADQHHGRDHTGREPNQTQDTPRVKPEINGNDFLQPNGSPSSHESPSSKEDFSQVQSPSPKSPPTLITTFSTPPKNFSYQIIGANNPIHPDYPSVINMDGKGTEISCGVCGVNAHLKNGVPEVYKGIMGMQNHIKSAHGEEVGRTAPDNVKACKGRVVSDEDVAAMLVGKEPVVKITKKVWEKPKPSPKPEDIKTPGSARKHPCKDPHSPTTSLSSPVEASTPLEMDTNGMPIKKARQDHNKKCYSKEEDDDDDESSV